MGQYTPFGKALTMPGMNRRLKKKEYARVLEGVGIKATHYDSVAEALADAKAYAKEGTSPLVCLGSLYMYCEVIELI
jgi:folylpolyglutamate synthase/dihydropteroate synthase